MAQTIKTPVPPSPLILAEPDTSPGPFEGPEKLLEVWFAPSADALGGHARPAHTGKANGDGSVEFREGTSTSGEAFRGLRAVPRAVWEEMLDIVKCKVLSVVEGEELDAYLLRWVWRSACADCSESSLFIAPHVAILKTCGTTLNLLGLHRILEIAAEYCGFESVWRCVR